jgi:signal transduction histidine kinase
MRISSSLSNRIFLACTLIAAVPLGFAFYLLNARAAVEIEADLRRRLSEEAALVAERRQTVTDTFATFARLLADLPKLKAAVETGDPLTVQPIADEYRRQIDADVLVLTSPTGKVLASFGADMPLRRAESTATPFDLTGAPFSEEFTLVRHARGLLQTARIPIFFAGEPTQLLLGHLTIGYFLNDQLAAQFKRLTGSEIAFVADGTVVASSLPANARAPLSSLARVPGISSTTIADEEFLVVSRPLDRADHATAPSNAPAAPAILILRSRTERLRVLNTIRAGLGGALIVTLLLATVLSYAVARTMTRPLAAVTRAMSDVAATGDLTRKVLVRSRAWDDEDARLLGTAFNRLTESVARFQIDAAQRERLSSLGRLSTVIAHEIRNPLMIVRASLAVLRREHVTPLEIQDVVADIDEETTRLNRIVTEVLDFAKPLRFDVADTDVNDVCRASTAAAWVGDSADNVRLLLAPDVPTIVTDAERLRTALVNVLTNARQSVAARAQELLPVAGGLPVLGLAALDDVATLGRVTARDAATVDEPNVVISTATEGAGVMISVADRGTGIAPQDLAHVFDPYYTTRRVGTGLGLPITKNIIEGLGGTIAIASRTDGGTEVRIVLPSHAPGERA